MVAACLQASVVRPIAGAQTARPARSSRTAIRCAAQKSGPNVEPSKIAALAAAASLMLAQPSFAGPLDSLLPDSAPAPPKEKFERDLGAGRKLTADNTQNNSSAFQRGKRGTPSDSADARDEPDVTRKGGGLPGISKGLAQDSSSAPLTSPTGTAGRK